MWRPVTVPDGKEEDALWPHEDAPNEEGVANSGPTLPKTPSCVVEATGIVSCAGAVVKGDSVEVTVEGMKRCHVPTVIQITEGAPENCRGSGVKLALERGRDAGVDEANSPSVGNAPGGMASIEISQLGGVRRLIGSVLRMKGSSRGVSSKGCLVGIHQSRVCRYLLHAGGEAQGIGGVVRNEAREIGRARCFARMGWWRRRFKTKEGRWLGLKAIRFGKDNVMEVDTTNNGGAEDTGEALSAAAAAAAAQSRCCCCCPITLLLLPSHAAAAAQSHCCCCPVTLLLLSSHAAAAVQSRCCCCPVLLLLLSSHAAAAAAQSRRCCCPVLLLLLSRPAAAAAQSCCCCCPDLLLLLPSHAATAVQSRCCCCPDLLLLLSSHASRCCCCPVTLLLLLSPAAAAAAAV
ncbi:unnamed protein product [Closterium sp. NIES-54]